MVKQWIYDVSDKITALSVALKFHKNFEGMNLKNKSKNGLSPRIPALQC